jgi:hypothetical protein
MKRLNVTDRHQSRSSRQKRANNGTPKPDWNLTLLDDRCAGDYCEVIYHLDSRKKRRLNIKQSFKKNGIQLKYFFTVLSIPRPSLHPQHFQRFHHGYK